MAARPALLAVALSLCCILVANAQSVCQTSYSQVPDADYDSCVDLPKSSALLAWTWDNATRLMNGTFVNTPEQQGGWISWGINHNNTVSMEVSSVLTCFPDPDSGSPVVQQYFLTGSEEEDVTPGGLLTIVSSSCVIDSSTTPQTMYLTFVLNLGSKAKLYQIYGGGPGVTKVNSTYYELQRHDPRGNVGSFIDVRNTTSLEEVEDPHRGMQKTHGILNVVGWGILLPLGAMMARYGKAFADPAWFYTHIALQLSGYVIGVVGFGYGLRLAEWSGPDADTHKAIGIAIFTLATLQVLVAVVKPHKESKLRIFWNLYHWAGGYVVIVLAIVNNLIGFHLLEDYGHWRTAYIGVIACFAGVALVLEVVTWILWLRRPKPAYSEHPKANTANGAEAGTNTATEQR